uniref:Uncharacterized protein n=1 Tax=Oryza barthii TaxID=65489 RepID=A0A0D3EQE4_9ORYZ
MSLLMDTTKFIWERNFKKTKLPLALSNPHCLHPHLSAAHHLPSSKPRQPRSLTPPLLIAAARPQPPLFTTSAIEAAVAGLITRLLRGAGAARRRRAWRWWVSSLDGKWMRW